MAQSYLVFDFGANEEAAQQARHRIEGWKQAFRLGSKLLLKFERQGSQEQQEKEETPKAGKAKAKSEKGEKKTAPDSEQAVHIRLFVRLDFSDHEKLSHQRWLDRIPTEEPFKSAKNQVMQRGEDGFEKTAKLFESLA